MTTEPKNNVILRMCRGESVEYVPVWLMRQAGRFLPRYRQYRQQHAFMKMCETPSLVADITLMPLDYLNVDAVVIFSDIVIILKALGFIIRTTDYTASTVSAPIMVDAATLTITASMENVAHHIHSQSLESVMTKLTCVYEGIRETLRRLEGRLPLIGFAATPWTLLSYLIEGGHASKKTTTDSNHNVDDSEQPKKSIQWLQDYEKESKEALYGLADIVAQHLIRQADHGCHLVQLFDSVGHELSAQMYKTFNIPLITYIAQKFKQVHPKVPFLVLVKGIDIELLSAIEAHAGDAVDGYSLHCSSNLGHAAARLPEHRLIQGNLDPEVLLQSPECIQSATREMLNSMFDESTSCNGNKPGGRRLRRRYIANLGGGCLPTYDPNNVKLFVDTVHDYSRQLLK